MTKRVTGIVVAPHIAVDLIGDAHQHRQQKQLSDHLQQDAVHLDDGKEQVDSTSTTKRKLVPQRGWCRGILRTFSTVSSNPFS